jgi:hypothetical protein
MVSIDHRRPPGPRFDSHAARDWIATRALYLLPEINVSFRPGAREAAARARLIFRLPRGWRSASALAPVEENTFVVDEPGKRFSRRRHEGDRRDRAGFGARPAAAAHPLQPHGATPRQAPRPAPAAPAIGERAGSDVARRALRRGLVLRPERSFARGVALFARYGRWGLDLSHTHEPAALNDSAPFVMFWLDQEIRAASAGGRSLARDGGALTTPGFVRAVNRAAGRDLSARFARAVLRGERPTVRLPGETPGA